MGTYSPIPTDVMTFQKLEIESERYKKSKGKFLGSEERFKNPKQTKSLLMVGTPGPGNYPLIA